MADISEFLQSLNDKELRAKCIEYNLPNIPVTNTSRSILIRRLKEAITGEKDSKKKPRKQRETIHAPIVIEDDEDDVSDTPPARFNQTFPKAAVSKSQASRKVRSKEDESRQATEATTSVAASNVARRSTGTNISTKPIPEIKNNPVNVNYPYDLRSSPANSSRNSSGSKSSVTLSRSGISTTSYSVQVEREPSESIDESEDEEEIIDEGEFEIENSQANNNNYEYKPHPTCYNLNVNKKNLTQSPNSCLKRNNLKQMNIPPNAPQVSFYEPEQGKITFQSSSSNLSYKRPSIETLQAYGNDSFSFPKQPIIHKVEIERPSLYPFQMLNNAAESMTSSMDSGYIPSAPGSSLKMNQRKSTSTVSSLPYQRTPFKRSSGYKSTYGYHDEDEAVTGSGSSNSESEYEESSVSNEEKLKTKDFSRTLKPHSTPNSTYGRSPLARRSLRPENSNSIMTNFTRILVALDEKYKIFTFIVWSAAIIIIIFLVVLFFL